MWLPTPIYERAPQLWLLLGLLFISSGVFVGFEHAMAFVYIGVGFFCIAWSGCISLMRSKFRQRYRATEVTDMTPPLDLTQPVHVSKHMHAMLMERDEQPSDAVRS